MRNRTFLFTCCVLVLLVAVGLVRAEELKSPPKEPEKGTAADSKENQKTKDGKEAKEETKAGAEDVKKAVEQAGKNGKKSASTPLALTPEAIQELEQRKAALDLKEKQLAERARDLELQEKLNSTAVTITPSVSLTLNSSATGLDRKSTRLNSSHT